MTFEELLARDGRLVYKIRGASMEPMLRQDRDLFIVSSPSARLKKYDVALYKRGSSYVLHRVIEVKEDYYLIRGDNTFVLETVPDAAVIGVLTGFQRKGKYYGTTNPTYQRYVRLWDTVYPLRLVLYRCRKWAVGLARKAGLLPVMKRALRHTSSEKRD